MNYFLIFLCVCLLYTSTGQFGLEIFGKSCNTDSQCRRFKRGECTEEEKIIFFLPPTCKKGKYVQWTIPGKCIKRSNPICDVGSKLKILFSVSRSPNNSPLSRCLQRRQTANRRLQLQRMCSVSYIHGLWTERRKYVHLLNLAVIIISSFQFAETSSVSVDISASIYLEDITVHMIFCLHLDESLNDKPKQTG